ncbi:MAG: hypothetical protein JWP61_432 [Friedmanniella sp.]|nr:hypothetical protein [Friedmanniella sp.]
MTYAMTLDLPVPVENYDRMHAELSRLVGSDPEGLLSTSAEPRPPASR